MDASIAQARLEALRRLDGAELRAALPSTGALLELIDSIGQLSMVDARAAVAATSDAIDVARRLDAPLACLRAQRAHVRALAYAGRYEEALAVCDAAESRDDRPDVRTEQGRLRLASMHPLAELGRLDDAIAAGHRAIEDFTAAAAPALGARAEINIGVIHQRRDAPEKAVGCFDRARRWVADDPVTLGHLENNRGEALLAMDRFEDAATAFRSARTAFDSAGAELTAGIAEGNLADLAVRRGDLATALKCFERARQRLQAAGSPVHVARLIAEQAEAKALLGLTRDALADHHEAIGELDRHGLALEAARARAGLGATYLRLGRGADAETALAAAAHGFEDLGHATARARVELMRAEVLAESGRLEEAERLGLSALALLHDRQIDAARARCVLGRLALRRGAAKAAEAELTIGLDLVASFDLAPLAAELHHARGLARRLQGRLGDAVTDMRTAVRDLERVRGTLQADRFRSAFLSDRAFLYEDLVAARLDEGGAGAVTEALELVELAKSRTLLEQVLASGVAPRAARGDADDELSRRLSSLHASLNALYSRAGDERFPARPAAEWRSAVAAIEDELASVEQRIDSARGVASLFARPRSGGTLRSALDSDEVLLEYFATGSTISAFVIRHDGVTVVREIARGEDVAKMVESLRFQIGRGLRPASGPRQARILADCQSLLQQLHETVFAAVREAVGTPASLIVAPHGPLHLLPFHALHDGEQWLLERFPVSVTPSASVLRAIRTRPVAPTDDRDRALVAGVGDAVALRPSVEADDVARTLESNSAVTKLTDDAATVDALLQAATDADLVHLACHAQFDAARPMRSGLQMADRLLTLRDLYGLRTRARLVTLSACETGLSHVDRGDELVGLVRAFLAAGASNVVAAQWPVDDARAAEFMDRFYASWPAIRGGTQSAPAALRRAQLETLERAPHPAHWAPFFLAGGCR